MADSNKRKERTGDDRDERGLKRSKVCKITVFLVSTVRERGGLVVCEIMARLCMVLVS